MNPTHLEQIVNAVLYEGYILYPYRASSTKNQRERFTFGRVYPEAYSAAQNGAEPCVMQTECLLTTSAEPSVEVSVRFLQPMLRQIGELLEPLAEWNGREPEFRLLPELRIGKELFQTWHEAVERKIDLPLTNPDRKKECEAFREISFSFGVERQVTPIRDQQGKIVGVIIRTQPEIKGKIELSTQQVAPRTFKITARIFNQTVISEAELRNSDAVMLKTFASTHTLLSVKSAEFISMMDPGDEFKALAADCKNIGTWPVLVGDEGERTAMLSSPIILYDYPKIAPESAGSLFDATEIDEILTLRLQTLTDAEKFEMRQVDELARKMLERTDTLSWDEMQRLHGTIREAEQKQQIEFDDFFGASTRLNSVKVAGVELKAGDRVRIRPKSRADVMDLAIAGQVAIVEAVEQDLEKHVHLAVVLENDPGKDLGLMRQPGHRFFYSVDEVEPLIEEAAS